MQRVSTCANNRNGRTYRRWSIGPYTLSHLHAVRWSRPRFNTKRLTSSDVSATALNKRQKSWLEDTEERRRMREVWRKANLKHQRVHATVNPAQSVTQPNESCEQTRTHRAAMSCATGSSGSNECSSTIHWKRLSPIKSGGIYHPSSFKLLVFSCSLSIVASSL